MSSCPGITDGAYLQSVLTFVDCQAQTIGAAGYQAAAAPGSPLSLLLTGLVTLFIAFYGYRLLFGDTPNVREAVLALVKIGVVLALATSWGAYRTLAYDVAMHGPAELAAGAGAPAGLPGAAGGLTDRLQQVDNALIALNAMGTGPAGITTRPGVNADGQPTLVTQGNPEPPSIVGPFALGTARITFLTATIAAYGSVRLVAGLLLALGPFFIALLLFEGTRSLFEGWVRGLVAAMLGAVAVTILLSVELALLEPWLTTLLERRQAGLPIGGATSELFVTSLAFGLALLGGLGMAARVAMAFRIGAVWRSLADRVAAKTGIGETARAISSPERRQPPAEQHSRAAAVAEAVARIQRQETALASGGGAPIRVPGATSLRDTPSGAATPLGQSHRRTRSRVSASATRRDRRQ
ncbi:type IV secretion system protein [Sphingomonas kyeonggiensis]|uniref:Type IV secretion system protein VirB6 n=1 Tax=Sphingomonas kyeonggiensis TaxID=1268553 RepID=A0A7W6JW58_9SPHN|nr:type IV secretion system protein [Sphingomonas kyeonggiensis]MBB4100664.1 type IV secretion system protein VirB6 [Sphingomonas kyeonggiensis]